MFLRPCVFILLTAFLWQSLMVFGAMSPAQRVVEMDHMVAYSQDAVHHHHADNALHMDDDGDTVQHQHADYSSSTAALLIAMNTVLLVAGSMAPPEAKPDLWLSTSLEGLLRPPKQHA